MNLLVVATFSDHGETQPSVIGHSPEETIADDVSSVLEAFCAGGMTCIHLVIMKEER